MEKNKHIWFSVLRVSNKTLHISSQFISGTNYMESKAGVEGGIPEELRKEVSYVFGCLYTLSNVFGWILRIHCF